MRVSAILLGRGREDDHVGFVLLDRVAVALVDEEVAGRGQEGVATNDGAEAIGDNGGGKHESTFP
jgi:hypothetical protein